MRAVADGRLDPAAPAFRLHIDRCLGCRACEPVCPSGVEYGALLERARSVAAAAVRPSLPARLLLRVYGTPGLRALFHLGGRMLRAGGVAAFLGRRGPGVRTAPFLGLAMLAASAPWSGLRRLPAGTARRKGPQAPPTPRGRVALLSGCVQEGLFQRVNQATRRVLAANGFEVVTVPGQECCGALHAHGGDLEAARGMARRNVRAFLASGAEYVVVNAAGCGAAMKEYGHLLEGEADAQRLAQRVRDALELLAEAGPREGGGIRAAVAYDHPCHLLHAQGVRDAPLKVLAAIPGLEVRVVDDADECCGGAGIYGLTHPDLGGRIGRDKAATVRATGALAVTTPNPGCIMQIGGMLRLEGAELPVVHPLELLDESYRRAGYYGRE